MTVGSTVPFIDPIQNRILEVALINKCLITVARPVLWMSFACVEHHGISAASVHVCELLIRDYTCKRGQITFMLIQLKLLVTEFS